MDYIHLSLSSNSSDSDERPSPAKKKKRYIRIVLPNDTSSSDTEKTDTEELSIASSTDEVEATSSTTGCLEAVGNYNIHDQPTQLIHTNTRGGTADVGKNKFMEVDPHPKSGYEEPGEIDDGLYETEKADDFDESQQEKESINEISETEIEVDESDEERELGGAECDSSSGSDSISGAETFFHGVPQLSVQETTQDSLIRIQIPDLPEIYDHITQIHVQEEIYSPVEFSIHLYKLSRTGQRRHFIPVEFVQRLRALNLEIGFRRYVLEEKLFVFSLLVYEPIITLVNELNMKPEESEALRITTNGRCRRAVTALCNYLPINLIRMSSKQFLDTRMLDFLIDFDHLRPYQLESIEFAINRHGRCMFADESGLGKRVEAIVTGIFYQDDWPMLIVCAPSRICDWEKELLEHRVKKSEIVIIRALEDCEPLHGVRNIVIVIGYKTLQDSEIVDQIKDLEAKVLILDESHRIKHISTKTTQVVRHLTKRAKRRLLLTANPALGVPAELFRQLHALDRKTFKNHLDFADQYCGLYEDENGKWQVSRQWRGAKNLEELRHLIFGTLVIRHFRSDYSPAYIYLPTINREKVILDFHPDERTRRLLGDVMYKESRTEHDFLDAEMDKGTRIFKWFKRSGIAKLMEICKYLDSVDYLQNKVIIYARHKRVMDGIEQLLRKKKLQHVIIRGDYETREDKSEEFNSNPKIRVALLSLDISQLCINLSSANLVIFAELFWVPDSLFRNENRSYSLNSSGNLQRTIQVKYLIARELDTSLGKLHIDSALWDMLIGKMDVLKKLGLLRDAFADNLPEFIFEAVPSNVIDDLKFSDMSSSEAGSDSDEYKPSTAESGDDDEEDSGSDEIWSGELGSTDGNEEGGHTADECNSYLDSIQATSPLLQNDVQPAQNDDEEVDEHEALEEHEPVPRTMRLRSQSKLHAQKSNSSSEASEDEGIGCQGTRRAQALDSSDSEGDGSSNSGDSMKKFVASETTTSSSDADGEEEDDDGNESESHGKKQKKITRKKRKDRKRSYAESSESEDYDKAIKKNTKSYFRQ